MAKKLPRVSKKAFDLAGNKAQVLLLHGYTGSPYDLRPMGDFLHHHGLHVVAPLLKGHGTTPEHLYEVVLESWLTQSANIVQGFDDKKPIIVGGLSMGALLAIALAGINNRIKALLLFSPALCLGYLADLVIALAHIGLVNKKSAINKFSGSDISDPEAKLKSPSYKEMPIAGFLQFERLQKMAKERLAYVATPIFMAFGKKDAAIDAFGSHQIVMESTSQPIFSKFYERSKHVVTLDYDRDELCNDVWYFLTHHVGI
jgi:carboxylesterase